MGSLGKWSAHGRLSTSMLVFRSVYHWRIWDDDVCWYMVVPMGCSCSACAFDLWNGLTLRSRSQHIDSKGMPDDTRCGVSDRTQPATRESHSFDLMAWKGIFSGMLTPSFPAYFLIEWSLWLLHYYCCTFLESRPRCICFRWFLKAPLSISWQSAPLWFSSWP